MFFYISIVLKILWKMEHLLLWKTWTRNDFIKNKHKNEFFMLYCFLMGAYSITLVCTFQPIRASHMKTFSLIQWSLVGASVSRLHIDSFDFVIASLLLLLELVTEELCFSVPTPSTPTPVWWWWGWTSATCRRWPLCCYRTRSACCQLDTSRILGKRY